MRGEVKQQIFGMVGFAREFTKVLYIFKVGMFRRGEATEMGLAEGRIRHAY